MRYYGRMFRRRIVVWNEQRIAVNDANNSSATTWRCQKLLFLLLLLLSCRRRYVGCDCYATAAAIVPVLLLERATYRYQPLS